MMSKGERERSAFVAVGRRSQLADVEKGDRTPIIQTSFLPRYQ
ncbi:MAG: hypothetical protein AAGD25_33025 [Cyanobacteria bacterium P01_F01_bin.150]